MDEAAEGSRLLLQEEGGVGDQEPLLLPEPDQLTLGLLTLGHCQRAPALVGPTCSGSKSATPTAADLNPLLPRVKSPVSIFFCCVREWFSTPLLAGLS